MCTITSIGDNESILVVLHVGGLLLIIVSPIEVSSGGLRHVNLTRPLRHLENLLRAAG